MFEIESRFTCNPQYLRNDFTIRDHQTKQCLHSDGTIYSMPCNEWWPTREQAQAVLDKFKPKHVWKHGDVFKNGSGHMMYLISVCGQESMVWIDDKMIASCSMREYRRDCTFLFNIKDILSDRGMV